MKLVLNTNDAQQNFAKAVDQLGKLTGLNPRKIVMAEAGSVLKASMANTPKAPAQAKLTQEGRLQALKALKLTGGGEISINAGLRGPYGRVFLKKNDGSGYRRTHDANFSPINRHYSDATWAKIKATIHDAKRVIQKVVPQVKGAAGLARQSWVIIADSLGIRLENVPGGGITADAITRVRSAVARGNKQVNNGASRIQDESGKFSVTLINRLPYGNRLRFQGILTVAIANRAKFMQTAIAKGFTGSAEQVAKLFPGWTVKGGNN